MYLKETGCVDVDSSGLRQGPVAGSCEYGNAHLAFIKGGNVLTKLR